jgi:aromatic-L-amino-acid decarboxylase
LNTLFQEKINETSSLLELVTTPSLSLSVIRISPIALPSLSSSNSIGPPTQDSMNTVNQTFYSRLSARNDILLTQTILNGTFCVRFAIGSERTTEGDICRAVSILTEEAESVVKEFRVKNDNLGQGIGNGSVNGGA